MRPQTCRQDINTSHAKIHIITFMHSWQFALLGRWAYLLSDIFFKSVHADVL
jgi:hypothetical protein